MLHVRFIDTWAIIFVHCPLNGLVCSLQVYVRGGSGGEGAASFKVMAKKQRGQPNGGSGGKGGDVTLVRIWLGLTVW